MPPVVAAVAAGIASGFAVSAAGAITFSLTAGGFLLAAGSTLILSTLQSALAPSSKSANLNSFAVKSSGLTHQLRQPITPRRGIYGEQRVSGPLVFTETTENNKYLHMVIALASHEVEEIGEVWINDVSVPPDYLDASGNVTQGRFANRVRIKKHLGTATQTADSDLVAESSKWTSNHRLQEIAYIYIRLEFDRDVFPTSIPNFSAWIKGKKIYDPRTSTTAWTPNSDLQAHDYLRADEDSFVPGIGASAAELDDTFTNSAANVCEEIVTTQNLDTIVDIVDFANDLVELTGDRLPYFTGDRVQIITTGTAPAGLATGMDYYVIVYQRKDTPRIKLASSLANAIAGTELTITDAGSGTHTMRKTGEPRYFGGGVVDTDVIPADNLRDIISGMGGKAIYVGGKWKLFAASYQTPVDTFDESHLTGPLKIRTKVSRSERFNTVKGIYVSHLNDGQPDDYPIVTNSTYVTNDNGQTIIRDLDLPYTPRPHTAQRLAKIMLEKHRQEIVSEYPCNLHGMKAQPGGTLMLDNTRMGWASKVFEIAEWQLSLKGDDKAPLFGVDMVLQETAPAVYDWNSGEETSVDPAPNTNLPDPFTVSVVGGFSLDSVLVLTEGGDKTYKVIASWESSSNQYVISGGGYEVEFKRATETDSQYKSLAPVDGTITHVQIAQLEPDVLYDIRVFAFNNLGVRSAATLIEDFLVGTTVTTDTEDWESETFASEDWENDSLASEDWEA